MSIEENELSVTSEAHSRLQIGLVGIVAAFALTLAQECGAVPITAGDLAGQEHVTDFEGVIGQDTFLLVAGPGQPFDYDGATYFHEGFASLGLSSRTPLTGGINTVVLNQTTDRVSVVFDTPVQLAGATVLKKRTNVSFFNQDDAFMGSVDTNFLFGGSTFVGWQADAGQGLIQTMHFDIFDQNSQSNFAIDNVTRSSSGGQNDGSSPFTPLLPSQGTDPNCDASPNCFLFISPIGQGPVFIDPVVAVGYEYSLFDAPDIFFDSVLISEQDGFLSGDVLEILIGSDVFELLVGTSFLFSADNVANFIIQGIDPGLALDPADPLAFVTGLTFKGPGTATANTVSVEMRAIELDVDSGISVPEPPTFVLMALAMLSAVTGLRRRKGERV